MDEALVEQVAFLGVVAQCTRNSELVANYDRLKGTNLSLSRSPIENMIDIQSGKVDEDMQEFADFVRDCVWERMPLEARANIIKQCRESMH